MKYRDYLILPVLLMFLVYASCAYVSEVKDVSADNIPVAVSVVSERDVIQSRLTSGRFVNEENARDYFVLKSNGKIVQYCGDKVYKGRWDLASPEFLTLRTGRDGQCVTVEFLYDSTGEVSGVVCNEVIYAFSV